MYTDYIHFETVWKINAFSITTESSTAAKRREIKRKKKKVPSQLISFDDDYSRPEQGDVRSPLYHSAPTTCLSSPAPTTANTSPFTDRLEKYAHLRELEQAKKALDLSKDAEASVGETKGMGNVNTKTEREAPSPLQDCEVFDDGSSLGKERALTFDDDSFHGLHEPSYQQLFENILPKHTDASPESNGNNTIENTIASSCIPVTKPQRPNSIYNQETGSYKSNQSNLSGDSFPSRLVSL